MKYKVAVVDNDELYLGRMCRLFGEKYADKLTIYSYSSVDNYEKGKENNRFDLVLYAEGIIAPQDIPKGTLTAYFVGQNDIDKIEDIPAICKFQKHEILLKQIMDMCLESEVTHYTKKNVLGNITKVLYVTSAQGGVGASTVAVAAAKHFAQTGKKVLYISLEKNSITDMFFRPTEESTFSDVIYTLKSKKSNMISRVENIVQKDDSGVYFFSPCRTVFDMNELTLTDIEQLLKEICSMGSYEYIIVDALLEYDEAGYFLCDYADNILLVSDGSQASEHKLEKLIEAMLIWDSQKDARFVTKSSLVYNRFDSKYGSQSPQLDIKIQGGIPKYEGAQEKQIADQIAAMRFWDNVCV